MNDDDERIMDVNHPKWARYLRVLNELLRCSWCDHRRFRYSKSILRGLSLSPEAISASLDKLKSDGCGCDCAVLIRYWRAKY